SSEKCPDRFRIPFAGRDLQVLWKSAQRSNGKPYPVTGSRIRLSSSELANIDGGPIPNIVRGQGPGCFVSAHYAGDAYCVPNEALATAMVFDVLQQLRNLSITPSDLNAAFTVRLAN